MKKQKRPRCGDPFHAHHALKGAGNAGILQIESTERYAHAVEIRNDFIDKFHVSSALKCDLIHKIKSMRLLSTDQYFVMIITKIVKQLFTSYVADIKKPAGSPRLAFHFQAGVTSLSWSTR
ncbi:hypothetical protein ACTV2D_002795 [Cronobacter dublinensis]